MSGLATIFVADLLPILLIAGAGYLLARRGGVDVRTLSNVAFYVLLPCLIFHMLVTSTLTGREVGQMALAAALITAAMALVGAVAARLLGLARVESSAFLLVVMFSNGGNYGLPLVSFAFGPVALQFATVFFLTGAVLTFTIGGLLAAAGRRPAIDALRDVLKMPMVYAAVAALIVLSLGITISPYRLSMGPIALETYRRFPDLTYYAQDMPTLDLLLRGRPLPNGTPDAKVPVHPDHPFFRDDRTSEQHVWFTRLVCEIP